MLIDFFIIIYLFFLYYYYCFVQLKVPFLLFPFQRLGKGSVLDWGLRFIFLIFKKFLCFVVCCIFNGKKK